MTCSNGHNSLLTSPNEVQDSVLERREIKLHFIFRVYFQIRNIEREKTREIRERKYWKILHVFLHAPKVKSDPSSHFYLKNPTLLSVKHTLKSSFSSSLDVRAFPRIFEEVEPRFCQDPKQRFQQNPQGKNPSLNLYFPFQIRECHYHSLYFPSLILFLSCM